MSILLFVVDLVALLTAWILFEPRSMAGLAYLGVSMCVLVTAEEQRFRFSASVLAEASLLAQRLGLPLLVFVALSPLVSLNEGVLALAPVSVVTLLLGRMLAYALLRWARRHGRLVEGALVVGAGFIGTELIRVLAEHPEYGLRPVGIVDDVERCDQPVLGRLEDIGRLLDETGASHVIVAFSPIREPKLVEVVRSAARPGVTVHVVPRLFEVGQQAARPGLDSLHGIPLRQLRRQADHERAWPLKRLLDLVISVPLIVLSAPVMVIIAVAVRLGSSGPALFRQVRMGQRGKDFVLLKFRTLPVGYVDNKLNADDEDYQGPISRFLRRTNLDELPQLFNVVRGDMTLVGPRPERRYLVEQFNSEVNGYRDRHRLPMGVTGLAQVHGLRGDSSLEERARLDNYYIENWSLWQDVVILVRTFGLATRTPIRARRPT